MKMTDLRAKAREIFGSAVAEPMPKQPNGAKALQQRANARPIPTYKVGGVVKKANGGGMPSNLSPAEREAYMRKMRAEQTARGQRNTPEADDVLITTRRGQRILDEQKKRELEMERKRREKQGRADKLLGIPAKKDGGKVKTSSDTARKLATEMGGMKKGGKAKDGLAVMIAIGKTKPVKKAAGGTGRANMRSEPAAKNTRGLMVRHVPAPKAMPTQRPTPSPIPTQPPTQRPTAPEQSRVVDETNWFKSRFPTGYKKGGSPVKKAVGGAGKTRKGMAPIKKAVGGPIRSTASPVAMRSTGAPTTASPVMMRSTGAPTTASPVAMRSTGAPTTASPVAMRSTGSPVGASVAGEAPIKGKGPPEKVKKKAQGGAAKVRKGMMSPTGNIKQVVKPKKGIGGM